MFFIYPNQRKLRDLKNIANLIINILILQIPHLNSDILLIKFLYIFTKMKYQTYLKFQYGYYIEIFNSFLSNLFKKFLDRKHFNWQNRTDWSIRPTTTVPIFTVSKTGSNGPTCIP
jgi:hypothetical protein